MILTTEQLQTALEFCDNEPETELGFEQGEHGTFVWLADYPDEGSVPLDEKAVAFQRSQQRTGKSERR